MSSICYTSCQFCPSCSCVAAHSSFFIYGYADHLDLHSFPTRRSSDLNRLRRCARHDRCLRGRRTHRQRTPARRGDGKPEDRKSTRLNSSHLVSSYAVFCLKKKIGIIQVLIAIRRE